MYDNYKKEESIYELLIIIFYEKDSIHTQMK